MMDILEVISEALQKFYDKINPVTAIFAIRLSLAGLIFMTLAYNFIYRRQKGQMRRILGVTFFAISTWIAYAIPLGFIEESIHPGTYFVFGVVGIIVSIAFIPNIVTGIPNEQRNIVTFLFWVAIVLLGGQLIFGLVQ